jgi:hypothetical protein
MPMSAKNGKNIDKIFADGRLIDKAIRLAAREALLQHKRAGLPIVVYRNGKTVLVPAHKINVGRQTKHRRTPSKA